MVGRNTAVFGIFNDRMAAEYAIDKLKAAGFRSSDVSCLYPDSVGNKDLGHEKQTKAPEGTATGATTGAIIGGAVGWLVGVGALAIPGIGPFIAAGPIMAALAGAGVGGTFGGVTGALVGMGIPEYEAKRYEGLIKEGKILVSVHCDSSDWVDKAKEVLENHDGKDVASRSEASVPKSSWGVTSRDHSVENTTVL